MKINSIEIAGYESIVANIDVVNDEIRPINYKENFSCNDKVKGGIWYMFYFDNLMVTVICHGGSYGGDYGLFEIGIRDKYTDEWLVDNPYMKRRLVRKCCVILLRVQEVRVEKTLATRDAVKM